MILFELKAQGWMDWSVKTFEKATAISSLEKCDEEIKEIAHEIQHGHENLTEEYVDAIMCLLHSAAKKGITFEEISTAFGRKMRINMRRTWKLNPNNTYSHVK